MRGEMQFKLRIHLEIGSWVPEAAQLIRVGSIQSWLLLTKQRLC